MQTHPVLDIGLRNLVRHDIRHHGKVHDLFCDAFSQFGVAFPALTPIGIGPLCPKATVATYHISYPTLELHLHSEGQSISVQRQDLDCLPWVTTEGADLPWNDGLLHIQAEHVFRNERTLQSRFVFTNQSNSNVVFEPRWMGRISPEHEAYMLPYFHGAASLPRTSFLEKTDNEIIGGLRVSREGDDLPQVALRLRAIGGDLQCSVSELTYTFAGCSVLAPGNSVEFQFILETNVITQAQRDFVWKNTPPESDFDSLIAVARTRFANNIQIEKAPQTSSPALTMKAWRARHALLRNGYRGIDGEFGDDLACLCTADSSDFSCVFFWDTLFSSVAIADFHPAYARGAIRTAFVRSDDRDGSSPERKYNYCVRGNMAQQSPQSPVASWAVRSYLEKNRDPEFLREMYPVLVRNHDFWKTYSDVDRDGLSEYRWTGQVCDNSPLWDPYAALDGTTGCGWIPPVASVALNSFLFWDADHLMALAEMLGETEDVIRYRERKSQLERDLFAVCYLPEERRFWDYNHHTKTHRRVKTFYMFWPLFAGMNVPEETVRDLIENVLLDPHQFFGEIPFPSVAYDEPTYDSEGYWRGRAWPHISYWLIQTLTRYGYHAEAKEASRRTLSNWCNARGFPENMPTIPSDSAGFSDYNWGNAAVYLLATNDVSQSANNAFLRLSNRYSVKVILDVS